METFPRYWPFLTEIHRSPMDSPHKDHWRGALMFSLIYAWTNDWVNNRDTVDLRRHHVHYDITVVLYFIFADGSGGSVWQPAVEDQNSTSVVFDHGPSTIYITSLRVQGGGPHHDCYVKTSKIEVEDIYSPGNWVPVKANYEHVRHDKDLWASIH